MMSQRGKPKFDYHISCVHQRRMKGEGVEFTSRARRGPFLCRDISLRDLNRNGLEIPRQMFPRRWRPGALIYDPTFFQRRVAIASKLRVVHFARMNAVNSGEPTRIYSCFHEEILLHNFFYACFITFIRYTILFFFVSRIYDFIKY